MLGTTQDGKQLGISEIHAEILPADKARTIAKLRSGGQGGGDDR